MPLHAHDIMMIFYDAFTPRRQDIIWLIIEEEVSAVERSIDDAHDRRSAAR